MLKLDINLHPSQSFNIASMGFLIATIIILLTLPLVLKIKIFLLFAIFLYYLKIVYIHGLLRHSKSIIRICLLKNEWSIWDHNGVYAAELCGSSTVTKIICILRFKVLDEKRKRSCIVLRDSLNKDVYKKILMCLYS